MKGPQRRQGKSKREVEKLFQLPLQKASRGELVG